MTHEAGIEAARKLILTRSSVGLSNQNTHDAIQAYLSASGMVLVPREPTEDMEDEGAGAYHETKQRLTDERFEAGRKLTVFPADWLKPVYAAMIAATPDPFKSKPGQ